MLLQLVVIQNCLSKDLKEIDSPFEKDKDIRHLLGTS